MTSDGLAPGPVILPPNSVTHRIEARRVRSPISNRCSHRSSSGSIKPRAEPVVDPAIGFWDSIVGLDPAAETCVSDNGIEQQAPPKEKAFLWTGELQQKFLELLVAYQRKYGRDQQFSWVDLTAEFEEATAKKCGKETLNNKHNTMKERWREWKDLKHGKTGLGWDPALGTIAATKDWWDKKIQENGNFKKFRKKGISPDLEDVWDQIYGGTVATGKHCVAPSMDVPAAAADSGVCEAAGGGDSQPANTEYDLADDFEDLNSEYGTGDGSLQNIMRGLSSSAPPPRSTPVSRAPAVENRGKRVAGTSSTQTSKKRSNRQSTGSSLFQRHLEGTEETQRELIAFLKDEESSNKQEGHAQRVMDVISTMVEEGLLENGGPLWCYVVDALINSDRASTFFLAMPKNTSRLSWLKWHNEKNGGQA